MWAAGGPLLPHADADGPPLRISVPQGWLHGAADAAAGALIALLARQKTGRGQHVDISAQESVTPATLSYAAAAAVGHEGYNLFPRPVRAPCPPGTAPVLRGPKWRVANGIVELTVGGGPFGQRSNALFGWMREERALPDRFAGWDWTTIPLWLTPDDPLVVEITAARDAIAAFVAPKMKADLEREAVERGLLLAPVNTMADLLISDHLKARGYFVEVDEGGAKRTLPGIFARGPEGMFAECSAGALLLGEHNDEVFGGAAPNPPFGGTSPGGGREAARHLALRGRGRSKSSSAGRASPRGEGGPRRSGGVAPRGRSGV